MKRILILAALLIGSTISQAKTICSVAASSKMDQTYDLHLFSDAVEASRILLIKNGSQVAEELRLNELKTFEQWKAIDGATLVALSQTDVNNQFSISVGYVDISNSENMLPLGSMASGSVSDGKPLSLIAIEKGISIVCFNSNF